MEERVKHHTEKGEGEIACNKQFLLFPQHFVPFYTILYQTFCNFY